MVPTGVPAELRAPAADANRAPLAAALTILSAALAVGIAAWLIPASIHIVTWGSADGVGRVALFAPASRLRWLLAGSLVVGLSIWFLGDRDTSARGRRASFVGPYAALWAWTVPFLPWVPDRFPLLLVLAGPVRWVIALAALAAMLARMTGVHRRRWPTWPSMGRKTAFAIALVVYLLAGYRSLHQIGLGGDEPHYLVLTQSLLLDHDIKIENNHARGDYRQYFGGALRPDYLMRGVDGEIYSIHAPGLPIIVLPAFVVAGAWGAVVMMCLFGALAALAIFDIAALVGGTRAAWATWASVCLTVPFIPHAWAIFPEMPGAAIVAWALLWTMRSDAQSALVWTWRGVCLAVLPWLHTKFSVFLAVLALALAWRVRRRLLHALAFAAPIGVSSVAWLAFFVVIYGTLDPQAPYGAYTAQFVRFENLPRSLAGAFFDQKFGLFVYAPIYMAALWGAALLLRDRQWRLLALTSVGLACLYTLMSARLYMWWGGSSAPARFLVPVAPLLAPALAAAFVRLRGGLFAVHVWLALAVSLFISAISLVDVTQPILFSNPHGVARIAEMFRAGSPLPTALPTFTEENWLAPLGRLGLWFAAALITAGCAWLVSRRSARSTRTTVFWPLVVEASVFLLAASILVGSYSADARAESIRHGRFGLLEAFDPDARRAFDYRAGALAKMTPQQWLEVTRLTFRLDASEAPDPQGRLTEGLSLPPGTYQVSVAFEDGVPRQGDLLAALGGGSILSRAPAPLSALTTMRVAMPIAVPRLWVQMSDAPSAAAARRVDIIPEAIEPAGQRRQAQVRRVESIAGRSDAYLAYVNDGAFPEGGVFWTRGTTAADVLVATAGAPFVNLTLHAGPAGGEVKVRVNGTLTPIVLNGGETRMVPVPVPAGSQVLALSVQSPTSFRPSEVDKGSTDTRELGCQVRIEVGDVGA